jgi:hypothetical protein
VSGRYTHGACCLHTWQAGCTGTHQYRGGQHLGRAGLCSWLPMPNATGQWLSLGFAGHTY